MFKRFLLFAVLLTAPLAYFAQVNISPLVMPRKQFLGANGQPLANGHVCTYETGTTTPKATFTDYTGGTSNPVCDPAPVWPGGGGITLDAGGYAHIWVNCTSTPYRVVVYDSNGVLQWTEDGVQYPSCIQPITCPAGQFLSALDTCGTPTAAGTVRWNHILDPDAAPPLSLAMGQQSSTWNNANTFSFNTTVGQYGVAINHITPTNTDQTALNVKMENDQTAGTGSNQHGIATLVGSGATTRIQTLTGAYIQTNYNNATSFHVAGAGGTVQENYGMLVLDQSGVGYLSDGVNARRNYNVKIDGNSLGQGDGYGFYEDEAGPPNYLGNRLTVHGHDVDIQDPVFSNPFSGQLDDATFGGMFTGTSDILTCVQIDATGTPDTFKWGTAAVGSVNCSNGATGVAITGAAQSLANGVTVTFAATTGHTLNSYWRSVGYAALTLVLKNKSGVITTTVDDTGFIRPAPIAVGSLPGAAAGNAGWMIVVNDSTAIAAEGQTCTGGDTKTALAFSDGVSWKCF